MKKKKTYIDGAIDIVNDFDLFGAQLYSIIGGFILQTGFILKFRSIIASFNQSKILE